MSQIAGNIFGIGTPAAYPVPPAGWGLGPNVMQTPGMQPWSLQPYPQPLSSQLTSGYGIGAQSLPQLLQVLQSVPQQLQQVQFLQQQQLVHLQQLLQLVPAQLQQIHHLIHVVSQQVQQLQHWQPGSGVSAPFAFGLVPQTFSGPSVSH
jgi:hypothetical protein